MIQFACILLIAASGLLWWIVEIVFGLVKPAPPPPKPPPPHEPDWVAMSKRLPYRVPKGREQFHVENSIYSPYR